MVQWIKWRFISRKTLSRSAYRVLILVCMVLMVLRSSVALSQPTIRSTVVSQASSEPLPTITPNPQSAQEAAEPDPRVLVIEVVVAGVEDNSDLQNQVYSVIRTQPNWTTTRSQLQEDINAIFATGFFSNVQAKPEDTPLGVRVTFEVQANPILQSVQLQGSVLSQPDAEGNTKTLEYEGEQLSLPEIVDRIFSPQYGQTTNLQGLQGGIERLNKVYQDNGYVLAQVIAAPEIVPDGTATLEVAEGVIENIDIRFLNEEGEAVDQEGKLVPSYTPIPTILAQVQSRPGEVFNQHQVQADVQRVYDLAIAEDVNISLGPGQDPREVDVNFDIINNLSEVNRFARAATFFGNTEQAIPYWRQVLQIAQQEKSRGTEIIVLLNMGNIYENLERYDLAIKIYRQIELALREWNLPILERTIRAKLAEVYREAGAPEQAMTLYEQVLPHWYEWKQNPEGFELLITEIIAFQKQLVSELRSSSDSKVQESLISLFSFFEPFVLLSTGLTYSDLGDYQQALYFSNQGWNLLEKFLAGEQFSNLWSQNDEAREENKEQFLPLLQWQAVIAQSVSNTIYACIGDSTKALALARKTQQTSEKYFQEFVRTLQTSSDGSSSDDAQFFTQFYSLLQAPFSSISCPSSATHPKPNQQSVQFIESMQQLWKNFPGIESSSDLSWGEALFLQALGELYFQLGDFEKAVGAYQQAVEIWQKQEDTSYRIFEASAWEKLGEALLNSDQRQAALDAAKQSLEVYTRLNDLGGQATALDLIGDTYAAFEEPQTAFQQYEAALKLWKKANRPSAEAENRYKVALLKKDLGNLSDARKQIAAAIQTIEVQPPRAQFSVMGEPTKQNSLQISPEYIKKQASVAFSLGFRTYTSPRGGAYRSYPSLAAYFEAKRKYYAFYIDLLMQLDQQDRSKRYDTEAFKISEQSRVRSLGAFRNDPQLEPASLKQIQKQILDDDTLLLEYVLGEQDSYLWVVSPDNITSHRLGNSREQIETAAYEFYNLLTEPSGRVRPKTTAAAGRKLSRLILQPVADQLGTKRLLIVADGILQYIPFSALPNPSPTRESDPKALEGEFGKQMQPMLIDHEIINLPAASTLVMLEQKHPSRPAASKALALFADPVFNHADDRVQPFLANPATDSTDPLSLSTVYQGVEALYPRLPDTAEQEAQLIQAQFQNVQISSDQVWLRTGFDANHQTAMSGELSQYKTVHFATHGTLSNETPERSGMLLSGISETGKLQRGLLSTPDVFKLNLPATDLVVLSGCRTGLGSEILGEGLFGLTGGFMTAGAERVVASLWSVQSKPTAELMSRFYQRMLDKNHPDYTTSPAKALRAAQLSMWNDPHWQTPYNWAAFGIQGRWQGTEQPAT